MSTTLAPAGEGNNVIADNDNDDDGQGIDAAPRRSESFSFQPSQALGYEDPEMAKARERMMLGGGGGGGGEGGGNGGAADARGERVAGVGRVKDLGVFGGDNTLEGGAAGAAGRRRGARSSRMR